MSFCSHAVQVRTANQDDRPSIVQIEQLSATAAHWPESNYEKALAQDERLVLVAAEDSEVLGFLIANRATEEWELENIAVSPKARRRGIGRALMRVLIEEVEQAGASEIRQEIRLSNQAAQQLGRSMGFSQQGRRPNYYREPTEDALLFKYLVGSKTIRQPSAGEKPS